MSRRTVPPAADMFRAAGEALHGDNWQSPLARELGVDGRTMRFWISGARPVPDTAVLKLPDIMRRAAKERREAAEAIERLAKSLTLA
jgi:hypothetical protein